MSAPAATFGPLIVETDIDLAVIAALKTWLPTYLAQIERDRNLASGLLARPSAGNYQNVLADDEFPDPRLPAVLVTTAESEGEPEIGADGAYFAAWNVVVTAVVRGRTPAESRAVAALFNGAVRQVLVQQGLELAGEVRWAGANVARIEDTRAENRELAGGINHFTVFVDAVVQLGVGPYEPGSGDPAYPSPDPDNPDAPYDPLAEASTVSVAVTGIPVTDSPGG